VIGHCNSIYLYKQYFASKIMCYRINKNIIKPYLLRTSYNKINIYFTEWPPLVWNKPPFQHKFIEIPIIDTTVQVNWSCLHYKSLIANLINISNYCQNCLCLPVCLILAVNKVIVFKLKVGIFLTQFRIELLINLT
jgi:hypothetical protein